MCKTQIIPLWVRWLDYKSESPILNDRYSYEILENSDFKPSTFDKISTIVSKYTYLGIILREIIIDKMIQNLISNKTNPKIVNLGCGLDARHKRLEGYEKWFDLDLPESIQIKKNHFKESSNYNMIESDMFDLSWMKDFKDGKNIILLCEGTLMYFKKQKVESFLRNLQKYLSLSDIIFEIMGNFGINKIHPFVKELGLKNKYEWGISNKSWFKYNGYNLIQSKSFFDEHEEKWGIINKLVNLIPSLKTKLASQIYHFRFK